VVKSRRVNGGLENRTSRARQGQRLILEKLIQAYSTPPTKQGVAAKAGYETNSGGFNNTMGRLKTLENFVSCLG
jgi:hypothetical protein